MQMKKMIFAMAVLTASVIGANAQNEGKWIGGGLSFTSADNGNNVETSSLSFFPSMGVFVSENWAIGGMLQLSSSKTENSGSSIEDKSSSFGLMPFARYYVGSAGRFSFFAQGELPIVSSKSEMKSSGTVVSDSKHTMIGLQVRPGISAQISSRFAAELHMPRLFYFNSYSGDREDSSMGLLFNSGYSIDSYLLSPTIHFVYKF
jgi:hypothetical protein